jgi:hypothetical protein
MFVEGAPARAPVVVCRSENEPLITLRYKEETRYRAGGVFFRRGRSYGVRANFLEKTACGDSDSERVVTRVPNHRAYPLLD